MSEWQPIETAPKNGAYFLGTDGERIAAFHWDHPSWSSARFWQIGATAFNAEVDYRDYDGEIFFEPTHWMLLPPPPPTT